MADRPEIMGIVNVTPDSFSDGGLYATADRAIAQGLALLEQGARILDIGGESTRPGAKPIDPQEEIRRAVPVIAGLQAACAASGACLSVDTRNAATMKAALAAGASLINDISALRHDPASLELAAAGNADIVLMHMQGTPETMQAAPAYNDVVTDVYDWLAARIAVVARAGIDPARLIADPGIGFGKTMAHNLALLQALPRFRELGVRLMVGASRKKFIATLSRDEPPDQRLGGSLAVALLAAQHSADILRVHDVAETAQALRVWQALTL